ncbi:MAG: GNAT family N-acetyltransferase, partial [Gemmataceae bacterium]|nr:GNAT family N-acetyltransferase [Gemmataceae bacterium]
MTPGFKFLLLTPGRWKDLEKLFGPRGACGGCWCMTWRLEKKHWQESKGIQNKRSFKKIVQNGERPGVIAYQGKEPVGWCALAPRDRFVFLKRSRVLAPLDDAKVWSITCLFIARPYRQKGLSVQLLKAAAALA